MTVPCSQCGDRPAASGLSGPASLIAGALHGRYCRDCAAGLEFFGMLSTAAVVIVGIVVAIILW